MLGGGDADQRMPGAGRSSNAECLYPPEQMLIPRDRRN